jgi:signal transduction histidine kinase
LLKLINDVIDLSSLEFGKLQFCIAQHDAVSICRNVIDTVNKVKQTQAELTFTTELEEMPIETDDSRLQQVLINLLINATKFTPQGSIVLKLEKETDDTVLFTVTDTGCGIPKDKQANIFQRFEKLNENAQGSGLGSRRRIFPVHPLKTDRNPTSYNSATYEKQTVALSHVQGL